MTASATGRTDETARAPYSWGADLGLLALSIGTAAGFIRLFDGWDFLGRILVPLVVAWACALGLRRTGVRTAPAAAAQVLLGVLGILWWFAWDTTTFGVPTGGTIEFVVSSVQESFGQFDQLVAPVPVTDGFLVVVVATLWVFAAFADAAAFRYRAPVQAAVPYLAAFVAVGVLAREPGRTTAAICFLVGLAAYAVGHRALSGLDERWVTGRERSGARALATSALALVAVAIVVGVAAGPRLPGSTEAVLDLRDIGRGDGPRTVVSPFVGIRSLLGDRSDEVMFTVEAAQPAYWRLTSLEEYDPEREIWISRGTYRRISGDLPPSIDSSVDSRVLEQRYRIDGLSGVWLPGAYVPTRIDSDAEVSFADRSSSLILREDRPAGELEYSLESSLPNFDALADADRFDPRASDLDEQYLDVPEFSPGVAETLGAVVAPADSTYEQMRLLQDWFRTEFDYDETVDFSGAPDAIEAFLADRRGFCQQFASTFALAARSLGIPSRVAVGFTPGEATGGAEDRGGSDPADEATSFVVRGRFAHAWPEVYFEGIGWVPFEPTPQRGDPQAQDHTGVTPAQAPAPADSLETTTSAPATTAPAPGDAPAPTTTPDDLLATDDPDAQDPDGAAPSDSAWLSWALGLAMLVAAIAVGTRLAVGRRRRTARSGDPSLVVADAWSDALRSLALLGVTPTRDETPLEFAARVELEVPELAMRELAAVETMRRFGATALPPQDCDAAADAAASIATHAHEVTTRRQRVAALLPR